MAEASQPIPASARNFESEALRRVADVQLEAIAGKFGCDKSTASRMMGERGLKLYEIPMLLEVLGWKIVSASQVCVPREVFEAYRTIAKTALSEPSHLHWGEPEREHRP